MKYFSSLLFSPLLLVFCLSMSACSLFDGDAEKAPLTGERISILDLQKELSPTVATENENLNIDIPPAINNADWPQSSGYPNHMMQNVTVGTGGTVERIWRSSIGKGSSDRIPLNAKPVAAAGKVFTLDSRSHVRAFHNQTGKLIWEQDVESPREDEPVIGGGLAYSGGVLFITSGYDEVLALNPEDGQIYWRTKITAGSRAAPTILNGRVFVTALNNHAIALDAANGKILWEYEGIRETTALLGAASPAANEQIAIAAFSTGDIVALRVENGSVAWEDSLSNALRLGGMAGLSDIRGNPVIAGDRVIAISYGNKMVALDKNTGARLWQREISSSETPWVSGNLVYVLTPDFKVVAMDITSGDIIWVSELTKYEKPDSRKGIISWAGPLMVNTKLLISGTGGRMVELDATTGKEINRWNAGDTASLAPIVAGGTLYVLTDNGTLSAYR